MTWAFDGRKLQLVTSAKRSPSKKETLRDRQPPFKRAVPLRRAGLAWRLLHRPLPPPPAYEVLGFDRKAICPLLLPLLLLLLRCTCKSIGWSPSTISLVMKSAPMVGRRCSVKSPAAYLFIRLVFPTCLVETPSSRRPPKGQETRYQIEKRRNGCSVVFSLTESMRWKLVRSIVLMPPAWRTPTIWTAWQR